MITKNVKLYLGDGFPVRIPVSQYDTMWRFVFSIINGSVEWTIPTGATAVLNGRKPDGNVIAISGAIADNKVTVDATEQMTVVAGEVVCELSIMSGGAVVGTANFTLAVEDAPKKDGEPISESDLSAYAEMIEAAGELVGEAQEIIAHGPFLPSGGTPGQVLTKTATGETWDDVSGLPDGGNNGQVLTKTSSGAEWSDAGTPTQAQTNAALAGYLDEHPEAVTNIPDRIKQALLACFRKVAWVDANGQTYYQNLYNELMHKEVLSIAAVFTQGSAVIYDTDSLDTLRQYLVVTASYEDGTTGEVTAYELSGTLTEGTSTITVSYGGKTTTFNVTVQEDVPSGYTRLKWVEANGNQYVNPNLKEGDIICADYEVSVSSMPAQNGNHILSSSGFYFPFFKNENGTNVLYVQRGVGGTYKSVAFSWTFNVKYHVTAFMNGTNDVFVDDANLATVSAGTFNTSNNFSMFAYGGNATNTTYRFHGKLYSMKLYGNNSALLRDFAPCKNQSNVVGLYDRVNKTFYSSATGAALIAGDEL